MASKSTMHSVGVLVGLYALTTLVLLASNPNRLPSVLLVLPFLLMFATIYRTIMLLLQLLRSEEGKVGGVWLRRPRVMSALVAAFPVMMLVFQSIGQLSAWDAVIGVALFLIAYIYISRSSITLFR